MCFFKKLNFKIMHRLRNSVLNDYWEICWQIAAITSVKLARGNYKTNKFCMSNKYFILHNIIFFFLFR